MTENDAKIGHDDQNVSNETDQLEELKHLEAVSVLEQEKLQLEISSFKRQRWMQPLSLIMPIALAGLLYLLIDEPDRVKEDEARCTESLRFVRSLNIDDSAVDLDALKSFTTFPNVCPAALNLANAQLVSNQNEQDLDATDDLLSGLEDRGLSAVNAIEFTSTLPTNSELSECIVNVQQDFERFASRALDQRLELEGRIANLTERQSRARSDLFDLYSEDVGLHRQCGPICQDILNEQRALSSEIDQRRKEAETLAAELNVRQSNRSEGIINCIE